MGEGEIGRVGDWEIGRVGEWEIGRITNSQLPIPNSPNIYYPLNPVPCSLAELPSSIFHLPND
ncbi:hypothetical protein IQ252_04055 [Tychonema sp. LEGE 07203]|nr:hypothetical protein [Tychonema sp. LEGE 07203]